MTRTADDRFFARVDALEKGRQSERYGMTDYLALLSESYSFGGNTYQLPIQTTYGMAKQEPIGNDFESYVRLGLKRNGIVFGAILARALLFSEARFCYRALAGDKRKYGAAGLLPLERPGVNQTTGELLFRMEFDASLAGNWYGTNRNRGVRRLRPDWVDIVIGSDQNPEEAAYALDGEVVGYLYWPGGKLRPSAKPEFLLADEVAHWSPIPDPECFARGMSWLTPVLREIESDGAATDHKQKFFENAATPNLAIIMAENVRTPEQFEAAKAGLTSSNAGVRNAYRTLFLAAGADVKTVGADMKQLDFKATQGAGETRIAVASRVPAPVLGISEGLAGSSLNAGNLGVARRMWGDGWARPMWRSAVATLSPLAPPPNGSELWFEDDHIAFLREDAKDAAEINSVKAQSVRQLLDGGFTPESAIAAVESGDMRLLKHTGLLSVQLQAPGSQPPAKPAVPPAA